MKLLEPGDVVEVKDSKFGYKGQGVLVSEAYSGSWLVRVKLENGTTRLITVKIQFLSKKTQEIARKETRNEKRGRRNREEEEEQE